MGASIWQTSAQVITVNAENGSPSQVFLTSAGQTNFTLTGFTYIVNTGSLRVYRNGVKIPASEVIETGETTFTLNLPKALLANETIEAFGVLGSQDAVTAAAISAAASAAAAEAAYNNGEVAQDLTFVGIGARIKGDFSNSTLANRVMFQTSTVNGNTSVAAIPNGTATIATLSAYNNSDPTNAGRIDLAALSTELRLAATYAGSGSYLPMTFYTGGSERMRIDSTGNVIVTNSTGGLGYGTGAGGTVTQATSKTTHVTLNRPTGKVTMNNAALGAGAIAFFNVYNSLCQLNDTVVITPDAASAASFGNYRFECIWIANGVFGMKVANISAGSLSEAVAFNFAIIKGATS